MTKFFDLNEVTLLVVSIVLSVNIFAGGVVTFTPSLIPCGGLGCGPLTITNATSKTIVFAGVAVSYQDPNTPLTNFSYFYTGCINGIIKTGSTCDVVINPNGFTLVPGNYAVRPLFYRTLKGDIKDLLNIAFDVQFGVDCTDSSQCTPDSCTAGSCIALAVCGNSVREGAEVCDDGTGSPGGTGTGSFICTSDCTRVPECGDGFIDTILGEICDIGDMGGETCVSQGFPLGGSLLCNTGPSHCTAFNTSGCSS